MASKEKKYCSLVLVDGMEYMVVIEDDWVKKGFEQEGFFQAKTLDGKPILFGAKRITILREVDEKEFKAWQESLKAYRDEKLKELRKQGKIETVDQNGKK